MTTNPNEERDAAETLLPWYATGTLDEPNRKRIEQALSRWPELRESLRLVEEDRSETIAVNEGLGAPRPDAWARILTATAAEPRRRTVSARFVWLPRVLGLGAEPNPTRLAWIAAAAALVIVIQDAAILALAPSRSVAPEPSPSVALEPSPSVAPALGPGRGYRGPGFGGVPIGAPPLLRGATSQTATVKPETYQTATAKPKEGADVLIAFAPDVRISDISAFLQERHGSIDEGPRGGMYRVRFGDKRLSTEETNALIKDLRASPIVRLALPGAAD